MTTPPPRATLKHVAERAQVALSTASLVFSGRGPVAAATRDRVLRAASDLGYGGPNPVAASLRRGRTGTIGVVIEEGLLYALRDPYALSVMDGLIEALGDSGVLLVPQHRGDADGARARLASASVDAVAFPLSADVNLDLVADLASRGLPMVGMSPMPAGVPSVEIDEEAAMALACDHVAGLGHERVAMIVLPHCGLAERRTTPFRTVFGADAPLVAASSLDVTAGAEAARTLLAASDRPTAIICQSDLLAMGVIVAASDVGLSIPEDLTVTGFDGIDIAWWPGTLTTVVQPGREKGAAAGRLLAAQLAGEDAASVVLPVTLRVGTSSGPPPH